jgi:hypothetical protein
MAGSAVSTSGGRPLSLDAQQLYRSLSDADVTVSTGYLAGSQEPLADQQRYVANAADQAVFHSSASAGSSAFGGLEVDVIIAAVVMAAGAAWGLSRRLAEYR